MKTSDLFFPTLTRPYNSWSDKTLATESMKIQTNMADNPFFPTTVPTMDVFSTAAGDFVTSLARAGTRDINAVAAKNAKRDTLIAFCIQLGNSVVTTANGEIELLVSSGLPMRKRPQPVVIGNPTNFRITNGINPGELDLRVDTMKGASSFVFEYTEYPPTDASVWQRTTCSTSRCTISGLTAGKKYWFRVAAIGRKGQQVWGETLLSPYVQ